jgi:hypothetical protein
MQRPSTVTIQSNHYILQVAMSEKDNIPRIVIARVGKRKTLSKQAEKDQGLISARVRQNTPALTFITRRLEALYGLPLQKKDLLVVARELCGMAPLILDRLAKRSRDCLLCWFCENWIVLEPLLVAGCSSQPRVENSDPRTSCACTPEEPTAVPSLFEKEEDFGFNDFGFSTFESPFGSEEGFEFFGVL